MLSYTLENNKYKTVKDVLSNEFNISNRLLIKLKKNKRIYLNGCETYVNHEVKLKDKIEVNIDFDEESDNIVPTQMDLDILYEDDYLLIINKNPDLPVHPSILHFEDSLSNGVKYYFEKNNIKRLIRPVNRLDKDTSGIVIFAKNEYIQECLVKQMKSNSFKKEYVAILEGHLENVKGTINKPISRKEGSIIEREINKDGENAITHFELIKNFEKDNIKLSYVKFILETGRTHQIRVHSKAIGHPILGDSLYGSSSNLISRQALHAYKITFVHPITKSNLEITSNIPEDIKKLI